MKTFLLALSASLFLPCSGSADDKNTIDCLYWSNDVDPNASELQRRGKCAYLRGDQIFISSATFSKLSFSQKGLASVFAEHHGWLFVRKDGSTIPTILFDNGPDDFVEGLARYIANGKIGFVDESGKVVIRAKFQFAYRFDGGRSMVCNGCAETFDRIRERRVIVGGVWGCIDKKGTIVIPVKYSEDAVRRLIQELEARTAG